MPSQPAFFGEIVFALWLVLKAARPQSQLWRIGDEDLGHASADPASPASYNRNVFPEWQHGFRFLVLEAGRSRTTFPIPSTRPGA
jgi:hypothetical protein